MHILREPLVQIPDVPEPPVQIPPLPIPKLDTLTNAASLDQLMSFVFGPPAASHGRWPDRVTYYVPEYPYTIFFEPIFGVHVSRLFGKTVIVFTSHLDLTWDKGVDLKFFRVGRSPSRQVWEAYQHQNTKAYTLDLTHCTRLADVPVTLLTWLDDWEMHRDENLPWRMVSPQPWKWALETHLERSHQKALAHGMPSVVTLLEHI
ncbi:uncharacterized protein TNCV_2454551 [Trichonephila clavipes]|nr:uncharacterized protein TNCV_2454551 [Trichonephila clavipes]